MMSKQPTGTCLYFGTFNPIHMGHLMIAQASLRQFGPVQGFQTITFVPAGKPPHRQGEDDLLDARRRLHMVQLAIAEHPDFRVSEIELNQAEQTDAATYTVDTLRQLQAQGVVGSPAPFIIGADALQGLPSWREPETLVQRLHFLQAPRPHCETVTHLHLNDSDEPIALTTSPLNMPMLALSSTWIRQVLREQGPQAEGLHYFLPEPVRLFIRDNGLYALP